MAAAAVLALAATSPVVAQVPPASRVAPESIAPPKPNVSAHIALPAQVTTVAPPGAAGLVVTVADVAVEGNLADAPTGVVAAIAEVKRTLPGHAVKVAEIDDAAARIEAAYARAGLILTRVTLPPQRIVDGGTVRLLVVDGYIECVDVAGVPARVRAAVRRRVAWLVGVHGLSLAQIERRVSLAGQAPGVRLRSTLVPGTMTGGTRLVLEASYRPVTATLSADNSQGAAYGYEALSAQFALNSALGFGEQIYATATSGPDLGQLFSSASRRRILGAGIILPIGDDGLTANIEYIRVDTHPLTPPGALATSGFYDRLAFHLAYPLIERRRLTLTLTGSFELNQESEISDAFKLTINEDKLRVATLELGLSAALTSTLSVAADGQVGIGIDALGARTAADAEASGIPLSRQGAGPDFRKFYGRVSVIDQLRQGFAISSITIGQASFSRALPSSAQISLDNSDGLTSFAQGANNIDSGVVERIELSRAMPFVPAVHGVMTPYLFLAAGYGHLGDPTAVEAANVHASSFGGGLRLQLSTGSGDLASFGSIEVARGHVSTLAADPTRISFSFNLTL